MTESPDLSEVQFAPFAPFFEQHKLNISAYKAVDSRLAAIDGDKDKAVKAWMESSDDESAVKLREVIAEATSRLKTLAETSITTEELSPEEVEKLKTEHGTLKEKVRAGNRGMTKLAEVLGVDISEKLKEMGDPTARAVSSGNASTGSGLPRASVNVTVYKQHDPDTKWTFENLSGAANHIDIPIEELQKLYANAGGVAHEEIKKIKTDQEFTYHNTAIANASVWVIKTSPKETAPRGRQAVNKPAAPKDPNEITDAEMPQQAN